ncbi:MAG: hypothetical protein ABIQ52_10395 [Vicinamibacterales bacterium]
MSDPRNVAHAKKVSQEKKHQGADTGSDAPAGQPGKKSAAVTEKGGAGVPAAASEATAPVVPAPAGRPPAALEGALVVLTKLKELEFHSRAHVERLAELTMTVEDELKQKAMVGPLAEVYAAQSAFQTKLTALIESYKDECDRMQAASGTV